MLSRWACTVSATLEKGLVFAITITRYFGLDLTVGRKREELVCKPMERKNILIDVHQASFALWQSREKLKVLVKWRYFTPQLLVDVEYAVECSIVEIRGLYESVSNVRLPLIRTRDCGTRVTPVP